MDKDYSTRFVDVVNQTKLRALASYLSYEGLVPNDKRVYSWMYLATDIEPDQIVYKKLTQLDAMYIQLGRLIERGASQLDSKDRQTYRKILFSLVGDAVLADFDNAIRDKDSIRVDNILGTLRTHEETYGLGGLHAHFLKLFDVLDILHNPNADKDTDDEGILEEILEDEGRTTEGIDSLFVGESHPVSEKELERGFVDLLETARRYLQGRL